MLFKHKAITLVEVLISIIIIGVGIIWILTVVINSLSLLDRVKAETVWISLAKEWIELIFSLRDSNVKRWINWDCIKFDNNFNCQKNFSDLIWNYLQIALNRSWWKAVDLYTWNSIYYLNVVNSSWFDINRLYLKTWNIYMNNLWWYNYITWQKTFFSRYVYFTGLYLEWDGWLWDKNKVLKVVSVSTRKKWFVKKSFVLESIIWDIY